MSVNRMKKFLIVGEVNAITYKDLFPLIKVGSVKLGVSIHCGDRKFTVPERYELKASGCGIDEQGERFIRVKGIRWFTNINSNVDVPMLKLDKTYNPIDYPKYENYDAIEVSKVKNIPFDYQGIMGVPITFIDKFNPQQFEIVEDKCIIGVINGKNTYRRILIKNKQV